jgi:hypothetical protein
VIYSSSRSTSQLPGMARLWQAANGSLQISALPSTGKTVDSLWLHPFRVIFFIRSPRGRNHRWGARPLTPRQKGLKESGIHSSYGVLDIKFTDLKVAPTEAIIHLLQAFITLKPRMCRLFGDLGEMSLCFSGIRYARVLCLHSYTTSRGKTKLKRYVLCIHSEVRWKRLNVCGVHVWFKKADKKPKRREEYSDKKLQAI